MKRIPEYDHFSKMTEEKFSLPLPLLTLAQIQTIHQSIHYRKKTGTREYLPVSLLASIQHLPYLIHGKSFILQGGLLLLFQIF